MAGASISDHLSKVSFSANELNLSEGVYLQYHVSHRDSADSLEITAKLFLKEYEIYKNVILLLVLRLWGVDVWCSVLLVRFEIVQKNLTSMGLSVNHLFNLNVNGMFFQFSFSW